MSIHNTMKLNIIKEPINEKNLEGLTRKPDTLAFLAGTPTRERFPHSAAHERLKAFFDTRVFKTHRHAVYQCLKKPPTFFRHASVFKTRVSKKCVSVFKTRVFTYLGRRTSLKKSPSTKQFIVKAERHRQQNQDNHISRW